MKTDRRRRDLLGFGVMGKLGALNPCFECGEMTKGLHHVVPVFRGGKRQLPLCHECHNRAHAEALVHVGLVREGLERAKARGVKLGAPVKLDAAALHKLKELHSKGRSYKAMAKALGISVGSVWNAINASKINSNQEHNSDFKMES